ncbi:hypothetical protein JVT61DRAFT_5245 [Boletus reticuloceps]|uniref:Uncharacterized protein n=1 Tax=Boletus reticuloceps TaxID=495285 RepID=A0A8I2Z210_9AGAM|nr:hypothetical protein JVT61DRAFT_5245 [Boletus reticuloceps]
MASHLSSLLGLFFSIPYLDILASFFPILNPYLSSSTSSMIGDFCQRFYEDHAEAQKYAILAIEYRRCLDQGFWHDYLVFDTAPLNPNSTTHQPNTSQDNLTHTYLRVERKRSPLGMYITDEVCVLGQDKPPTQQGSDECLAIFSWPSRFQPEQFFAMPTPNLLDVLEVIQLLSLMQPKSNFTIHQCHWFPQAIIRTIFHTHGFQEHAQHQLLMKIFHTQVPSLVLEIARCKKQCTKAITSWEPVDRESEGVNEVLQGCQLLSDSLVNIAAREKASWLEEQCF